MDSLIPHNFLAPIVPVTVGTRLFLPKPKLYKDQAPITLRPNPIKSN